MARIGLGRLHLFMPASPKVLDRVTILGMPVDRVRMDDAVSAIRGFAQADGFHLVLTADSSMIVAAQEDPEVARLFEEASLITPDSAGVLWAAKRAGRALPEKVSGVELVAHLCADSAKSGLRLYFLGAAEGVAEEAAQNLRAKHPGCQIVGTHHGYFRKDQDEEIARLVGEAKPDVLFVAMGIPRQEKFIMATKHLHQAKVAMGVGGSFDVYSGRVKRAPKVFQRLSLEWLWRLASNPKKISKVAALPRFVLMVLRSK